MLLFKITLTVTVVFLTFRQGTSQFRNNVSTTECIPSLRSKFSTSQLQPPDCVIHIEGDEPDDNEYKCTGYSAIKVGIEPTNFYYIEIVCTAVYKMEISVIFQDGFQSDYDARVQSLKLYATNSSDSQVDSHILKIKPHYSRRRRVRYSVRGINGYDEYQTVVLVLYKPRGNLGSSRVFWMPENLSDLSNLPTPIIEANEESVFIPCIPYDGNPDVLFVQDSDDPTGWSRLPVDGTTITHELGLGFRLNTTLYPDYTNNFRCWGADKSETFRYDFRISDFTKDLEIQPNLENVAHYMHGLTSNSDLLIECKYRSPITLDSFH